LSPLSIVSFPDEVLRAFVGDATNYNQWGLDSLLFSFRTCHQLRYQRQRLFIIRLRARPRQVIRYLNSVRFQYLQQLASNQVSAHLRVSHLQQLAHGNYEDFCWDCFAHFDASPSIGRSFLQ
jgi:hypothetical protein